MKIWLWCVSQNCKMIKVGKDLWTSFCPTSLLKQLPLEHITHKSVQVAFEYLHGGQLHNLFGQPALLHRNWSDCPVWKSKREFLLTYLQLVENSRHWWQPLPFGVEITDNRLGSSESQSHLLLAHEMSEEARKEEYLPLLLPDVYWKTKWHISNLKKDILDTLC